MTIPRGGEHPLTIPNHRPLKVGLLPGLLKGGAAHHRVNVDQWIRDLGLRSVLQIPPPLDPLSDQGPVLAQGFGRAGAGEAPALRFLPHPPVAELRKVMVVRTPMTSRCARRSGSLRHCPDIPRRA